jgi:urea transport system substrate-binding protein
MNISRRSAVQSLTSVALGVAGLALSTMASAADTIKVGVLHSLSGTMAISETVLKDTVLMAIDEINAACWARSSSPWSLTPLPTGPCSPKRPSSC